MGAAGKDFHVFNTVYRDNPLFNVVCFTATQIPGISGRKYPAVLAGKLYPKGIQILPEDKLSFLIKKHRVHEVALAYSDLSHDYVMHKACLVQANGADFVLHGPKSFMLESKKPVIAVTAVRTGCGKSQTARKIAQILSGKGKRVVLVRHPMPYGDLAKQAVQRFASFGDFEKHGVTIEEREEYERYVENGLVVFAGVDYEKILREAEKEADVIVWDGGNNDLPFFVPRLHIVVADPLRPGHEVSYYPGEANFLMAQVIVINKMNSAKPQGIKTVEENARKFNPRAIVIKADSKLLVDAPQKIRGKKVLVVDDGPTLTHGGMPFGAGFVAAQKFGAREIVDAQKFAVGSIKKVYEKFPHLKKVLPAMGYSRRQVKELEETINNSNADIVVSGTPIDLGRDLKVSKEIVTVKYELAEKGKNTLEKVLKKYKF